MKLIGLVGRHLSHSFSKAYFTDKFKKNGLDTYQFKNFELATIQEIHTILNQFHPIGFNVTIPYKEQIIPLLDEIDETAVKIGAVNTVKVTYDNDDQATLSGYNTDAFGFRQLIKPFLKAQHERALILGTGGASKAVHFVLRQLGVETNWISRNPHNEKHFAWSDMNEYMIKHHLLIINTTPLGMFPEIENSPPLSYEHLTPDHLMIDLIYNPKETLFMKKARTYGAKAINGMTMLHQQAEKSWEIYTT